MKPLWTPPQDYDSALSNFLAEVNLHFDLQLSDYHELWRWSVEDVERFWGFWWQQAELKASKQPSAVLEKSKSFETDKWFPDARLNFAENLLRYRDERTAIIFRGEDGKRESLSYEELYKQAASVAREFQQLGVRKGDRVAAIMPNHAETIIGMLATSWLGAIWSSCSPDFGSDGILERFEQIQPKLLLSVDGYQFKGKTISVCEKVESIKQKLNCHCVLVNWQNCGEVSSAIQWDTLLNAKDTLPFEQVAFNDPLYILFSSGTTDKPKCIVHGVGGTLLQHTKEHRLHTDIDREDVLFYFTTCGWMMWNWLVSGLASGARLILYDGSPLYPNADSLFDLIDEFKINFFGVSAKYLNVIQKRGVIPKKTHDLSSLSTILSTGSPLAAEGFDFVYNSIKSDICLSSISGGTDIISCFVLGSPILPVRRGEIQCRGLGMDVDVFDENGHSLKNKKGELVCKKPFPSMPISFWDDFEQNQYRAAYFEKYAGVWWHGDYVALMESGGMIIYGRSDTILNPGGVRIGTAEIYRQVEQMGEILESLVVGQEIEEDCRIILFVILRNDMVLSDRLKIKIKQHIRHKSSPRHVPAEIFQVTAIPHTKNGKIAEMAVHNIIHGHQVKNQSSLSNPEALKQYLHIKELITQKK